MTEQLRITARGPYRVLRILGEGGMGVVYEARHEESGARVALKTAKIPSDSGPRPAVAAFLRCLRREVEALSRLRHPGIVKILDQGAHEGSPWYAMELIEGVPLLAHCRGSEPTAPDGDPTCPMRPRWWSHSLSRSPSSRDESATGPVADAKASTEAEDTVVLGGYTLNSTAPKARPRMDPALVARNLDQALRLIQQLCHSLAYLHGEGFVHRDLKPDNVLVTPEGRPIIVDFGLMAQFGAQLGRESFELGGVGVGTPNYMAPEQIRGEGEP